MHTTRFHTGVALTEYGLAVGLVVLAAIGSLTLLGDQVSELLGSSVTTHRPINHIISSSFAPLPDAVDLIIRDKNGNPVMTVQNYPATAEAYTRAIETVGAGGLDNYYANVLKKLSEIKDDSLISPQERDLLKKWAEHGFYLTASQKAVEDSMETNGLTSITMPDGTVRSLNSLFIIQFVTSSTNLSPDFSIPAALDRDHRKEYFQNPAIRSIIVDAMSKLRTSATGSINFAVDEITARDPANGAPAFYVPQNYKPEEIREVFAKYANQSYKASDTLCSHSETGKTDAAQLACVTATGSKS